MDQTPLILIIDDQANFLEIFSVKLKSAGFRAETALGGEEGIEKAKRLRPDLVLLDMQMPGVTGADVLLRLREDPVLKDLKILFISGLPNLSDEERSAEIKYAQDLGAVGYLKKTDDLESLVSNVQSFVSQKNS